MSNYLVTIGLYRLVVRGLEQRRASELDLKLGDALIGLGTGCALISGVYVAFMALGNTSYEGYEGASGVLKWIGLAVISGVCEEILFRGVLFRLCEDMGGTLFALVVSAAFFGGVHLGNPHATLFSAGAIAVEAGILLAAVYAMTRNLWMAIGLHIGWNFTEGGVFGAADSGIKGDGLFRFPLHGPDWITGGAFGPENSVITVIICTAAGLIFLAVAVRRGNWKSLQWRWRGPAPAP